MNSEDPVYGPILGGITSLGFACLWVLVTKTPGLLSAVDMIISDIGDE